MARLATMIDEESSVSVYNRYGIIFGVGLGVAAVSLAVAVRTEVVAGTVARRLWMVITGGLGG